MFYRLFTAIAAAAVLALVVAAPGPAAAHFSGMPGALNADALKELSGLQDIHSRRHRHRHYYRHDHWWWGAPFIAAPFFWGPYYRECGWVWVQRWHKGRLVMRKVWRCW